MKKQYILCFSFLLSVQNFINADSKIFPKRGEIYWVDFTASQGTEIKKKRPAIIISNNKLNKDSTRVIVLPLTSQKTTNIMPFEVLIKVNNKNGKILCDQITSIDKSKLGQKICLCEESVITKINKCLKTVLVLDKLKS